MSPSLASRTVRVGLAFATVYLVWGSTYLAIRVGVDDAPPLLFAGVRFLIAAPIMLIYAWSRGARIPRDAGDWATIGLTALFMLVGANGMVTWSEQWVESNQAALIVATSALWMAWFGTWGQRGEGLSRLTLGALLMGFAGVAVLVAVGLRQQLAPISAYVALLLSPVLWAAGSIISRRRPTACPPAMTAALQMLVTGVVMTGLGLLNGEASVWAPGPQAWAALIYLAVLGSCLAYGAYYWLVHEVTPAQLGTYAYVNPAVAVLLGWWVLDEHMHWSQWLGTLIVLGSVLLVTVDARRKPR